MVTRSFYRSVKVTRFECTFCERVDFTGETAAISKDSYRTQTEDSIKSKSKNFKWRKLILNTSNIHCRIHEQKVIYDKMIATLTTVTF